MNDETVKEMISSILDDYYAGYEAKMKMVSHIISKINIKSFEDVVVYMKITIVLCSYKAWKYVNKSGFY